MRDLATLNQQVVAEIIERVSLREVVEEYVTLQRAGREYKGLCPFHQEKTPSFHVIERKKFFYCFGCQTGGDVIKFLQLAAGLSRREAIERLARRAGISLVEDPAMDAAMDAAERRRANLLHALRVAHEVFRGFLDAPEGRRAREYLEERGVAEDLVQRYGLGYGGPGRGALVAALNARKVPASDAQEAGLWTAARFPGAEVVERFAGRLVFPVFNLDGAVIAFSGRRIPPDEDGPKYLNSPETAVFQKGDAVFGLYQARPAIRRDRTGVIVEGNFDVLAAAQAGIENAVAPLGTALTAHQVRTLKRFANTLIVMFDADDAGRKAARRAVGLLIEAGVEGRIATLPRGEDPDSLRRTSGAEALRAVVDRAKPMISFFCESLVEAHGRTPHGLRAAVEDAGAVFALERDGFRYGRYCEELARVVGVDVREVRRLLKRPHETTPEPDAVRCPAAERTLLEMFLLHPRLIHDFFESGDPAWLTNPEARAILADLMNRAMEGLEDREVLAGFLQASDGVGGLRSEVIRALATPEKYPADRVQETFIETMAALEREYLVGQRRPLLAALEVAQREGRMDEARQLVATLSEMSRRVAALQRAQGPADDLGGSGGARRFF